MDIKERVEYVIKAKVGQGGKKGEDRFVPHAHQSDIDKAVDRFEMMKVSMETKVNGLIISMEKNTIKTRTIDFTKEAEKLLHNRK